MSTAENKSAARRFTPTSSCSNCVHCPMSSLTMPGHGGCELWNVEIADPAKTTCGELHRKDVPSHDVWDFSLEHHDEFGDAGIVTADGLALYMTDARSTSLTPRPPARMRRLPLDELPANAAESIAKSSDFRRLVATTPARFIVIGLKESDAESLTAGLNDLNKSSRRYRDSSARLLLQPMYEALVARRASRLSPGAILEIDAVHSPCATVARAAASLFGSGEDETPPALADGADLEDALWESFFAKASALREYGRLTSTSALALALTREDVAAAMERMDVLEASRALRRLADRHLKTRG